MLPFQFYFKGLATDCAEEGTSLVWILDTAVYSTASPWVCQIAKILLGFFLIKLESGKWVINGYPIWLVGVDWVISVKNGWNSNCPSSFTLSPQCFWPDFMIWITSTNISALIHRVHCQKATCYFHFTTGGTCDLRKALGSNDDRGIHEPIPLWWQLQMARKVLFSPGSVTKCCSCDPFDSKILHFGPDGLAAPIQELLNVKVYFDFFWFSCIKNQSVCSAVKKCGKWVSDVVPAR